MCRFRGWTDSQVLTSLNGLTSPATADWTSHRSNRTWDVLKPNTCCCIHVAAPCTAEASAKCFILKTTLFIQRIMKLFPEPHFRQTSRNFFLLSTSAASAWSGTDVHVFSANVCRQNVCTSCFYFWASPRRWPREQKGCSRTFLKLTCWSNDPRQKCKFNKCSADLPSRLCCACHVGTDVKRTVTEAVSPSPEGYEDLHTFHKSK